MPTVMIETPLALGNYNSSDILVLDICRTHLMPWHATGVVEMEEGIIFCLLEFFIRYCFCT